MVIIRYFTGLRRYARNDNGDDWTPRLRVAWRAMTRKTMYCRGCGLLSRNDRQNDIANE